MGIILFALVPSLSHIVALSLSTTTTVTTDVASVAFAVAADISTITAAASDATSTDATVAAFGCFYHQYQLCFLIAHHQNCLLSPLRLLHCHLLLSQLLNFLSFFPLAFGACVV